MCYRGLVLLLSPFIQCLASIVLGVVVAMTIGVAVPIFCVIRSVRVDGIEKGKARGGERIACKNDSKRCKR
jgi:hypothetical protein